MSGIEYAFNLYNGIIYPASMREVVSAIMAAEPEWATISTPTGTLSVANARASYSLYMRENMLNPAETSNIIIVADGMSVAGDPRASPEECTAAFDLAEFKTAANAPATKRLNALYNFLLGKLEERGVNAEPLDFGWFGLIVQYAVPLKK